MQGVVLANDALCQHWLQLQHRADLVVDHTSQRDARPRRHDFGHDLGVHAGGHQRLLALQCPQFVHQSGQPLLLRRQRWRDRLAPRRGRRRGLGHRRVLPLSFKLASQRVDPFHQTRLGRMARFGVRQRLLDRRDLLVQFCQARVRRSRGGLAAQRRLFRAQAGQAMARVVDQGGRRAAAQGHARAGRVQHADRLVGQLPAGNVAMRQPGGGTDGLVQDAHAEMPLHQRRHAAQHGRGQPFVGLFHLDHLKAAGQRRVFLEELLVFAPRRGGDGAQFTARQRGFQQVGRVVLARLPARAAGQGRLIVGALPQDGRPGLLFVPGAYHGAWCFAHYLDYFAAAGLACAALDLRGHGALPQDAAFASTTIADLGQDVAHALDALEGPTVVVGHSMGALPALLAARQRPVAGGVLMAPSPPGDLPGALALPPVPDAPPRPTRL
ncbi:hypothetical protein G6F31_013966 [Rhizopus arrhizus]|nr:hypothetical protein G6F31_013966 [Rhizopus arrhizus]